MDPLAGGFAMLTPYQFAGNGPIANVDLDGLEPEYYLRQRQSEILGDGTMTAASDVTGIVTANQRNIELTIMHGARIKQEQLARYMYESRAEIRNNDLTSTTQYKMYEYNVPPFKVVGKGSKFIKNALKLSDNAFHSASGLTFKFGSKHGNRLSHVLEHTANDLTKNFHGVFTVGDDLVKTLDEAYDIAKKGGDNVIKTVQDNGNVSFVVDLGRKVGFEGGKKGSGKALNKINIVVVEGTDNVITAFPTQ